MIPLIEIVKKASFFIIVAVVLIFVLLITDRTSKVEQNGLIPITTSSSSEQSETQIEMIESHQILIDIKGEVINPGVYELNEESRVKDAVMMAGGFSEEADQSLINLAQKVHDEMIIIVPKIGEELVIDQSLGENISKKVRINYATIEEIQTLMGIGPSKAQAIIQYREENGFFQSIDDLTNVSGIGEKTLENIREDIQVP